MKIVIPGGSGQVGSLLARAFHAEGHDVCVLSRTPGDSPWQTIEWNGETLGGWTKESLISVHFAGLIEATFGPRALDPEWYAPITLAMPVLGLNRSGNQLLLNTQGQEKFDRAYRGRQGLDFW